MNDENTENMEAEVLDNLANLLDTFNQQEVGEKEWMEALELFGILAASDPDENNEVVAKILHNLAALHYNQARYTEAEQEYQEALEIRRELADKYPDVYIGK